VILLLLLLLGGDLVAAEKALAAGRPQEALDLLGDLGDGDDPRAWVVQGRARLALGDAEGAVETLVRASEKMPEDKALARDAALACWRNAQGMYARLYLEDAKRLAARAGFEELLADIDFTLEDYEAALARYRKQEGPHGAMRVADCLKLLGRADEAREAYAAAIEACLSAEDLAEAYRAAFAAGRGGRLLQWLDERIDAKPDDLNARLYRGYTRAASSMFPEAIEDLRFCLAKMPGSARVKERMSFALLQNGYRKQDKAMIAEAAVLAQGVLDADPADVSVEAAQRSAWEHLGWIATYRWQNGDLEGVYEIEKDRHARDPSDSTVALNYGMAARRLGSYDEARAAYQRMLEDSPDDPAALNDYGIFLDGLGDRGKAREIWEKVLAVAPENLDALENLFTDAWERGDTVAARDYARRGLAAARKANGVVDRWLWFEDRLLWAPGGFGG
jgi:tetratricopeptide (TPR) repeat protein